MKFDIDKGIPDDGIIEINLNSLFHCVLYYIMLLSDRIMSKLIIVIVTCSNAYCDHDCERTLFHLVNTEFLNLSPPTFYPYFLKKYYKVHGESLPSCLH